MATKTTKSKTNNRLADLDEADGNAKTPKTKLVIAPPNLQTAEFTIIGTAPLVGNKFSARAKADMKAMMEAGSTAKSKTKREPKNFKREYEEAIHKAKEGWCGIPAPAFRNAMISACRTVGFHMTKAKLAIKCLADGFDAEDGTPLVKITKGKPEYAEHFVRNDNGKPDIRPRPMWQVGWQAVVRVEFDADQFRLEDVANLLGRAGLQVGVGAGRPDSKDSNGMGWGTFRIQDRV